MQGDIVYSTNSEEFRYHELDDCLKALWNECHDGAPETVTIFQATDTGVKCFDCEEDDDGGMTEVTDFLKLTYKRTNADFDHPKWGLVSTTESSSRHVYRDPL